MSINKKLWKELIHLPTIHYLAKYNLHCLTMVKLVSMVALHTVATVELFVAQAWVQLSHDNDVVPMITKLNPLWSHLDCCKFCIHLSSLNVCHFRMVEAVGLKSIASRPSSVACPPC
jgi:hypothetical protein